MFFLSHLFLHSVACTIVAANFIIGVTGNVNSTENSVYLIVCPISNYSYCENTHKK